VLCDLTANATAAEPSRWVDAERELCALKLAGCLPPELVAHAAEEMAREREEAARVLYVAATRARDLLVVTAVGDERHDGWLGALAPTLYPPPERSRDPETETPPGCPAFGMDSVAVRPPGALRPANSVMPGRHRPEAGSHRVVWWDPTVLKRDVQESVGLVQHRLLEADASSVRSEEGVRQHAAWQAERARVREAASQPSLRVVTATEQAASVEGEEPSVAVESVGPDGVRPHGKRFGTLVHAVLARVDLDADRPGVETVAALEGRLLGATPEEIAAASEIVERALAHPLLRRAAVAAHAGRCRRETPVAMRLPDGVLVEGVVDAAFRDDRDGWTVLDFKTDVEIAGRLEEYRRQVALYARAIAQSTGVPARGVLLRV